MTIRTRERVQYGQHALRSKLKDNTFAAAAGRGDSVIRSYSIEVAVSALDYSCGWSPSIRAAGRLTEAVDRTQLRGGGG